MSNYRPDIDGLRAIAVLVVVFFHYKVAYFTGGFIGVDVFFVISGYLISSIIFKDLANNTFSFLAFYERRIRRIFPALFVMLCISTIIALILYDYQTLLIFGKSLVSTVLFASNFYFRKNVGYFAISPQQITLLHTWSLAIEEQFYLIFPIVIYFLNKYQASKINYFIFTGFVLSLGLCVFLSEQQHLQFAFYMLPTRAWEFLLGTLLALRFFPSLHNTRICHLFSIVGFGLILIAVFMFSSTTKYPSYYALLPVFGTALLIYSGENYPQAFINKILGFPLLVFIGKISYSLYLWHWVLYVFYRYVSLGIFNSLDVFILLISSFFLSFLSWRFIEQPFRYSQKNISYKLAFKVAFVVSSLFLIVGLAINKTNGFPSRFPENKILMEAQKDSLWDFISKQEAVIMAHPDTAITYAILGKKSKIPQLAIWGDSHAKALVGGLDNIAKTNNSSFFMATFGGKVALQYIYRTTDTDTLTPFISKKTLEFIILHPEIKTVLLVGRWYRYLGIENHFEPHIRLSSTNKNWSKYDGNNYWLFENGLRETVYTLHAAKRKIVLVTDVPDLNNYPNNLVMRTKFNGEKLNDLTPKRALYESNNKEVFKIFNQLKKEGLVDEILPLHQQFFEGEKTIMEENNHLLYRDDDHLSYWGSMKVRKLFAKYMKNEE
jgi:peptidoglycan/LPS O-acetylase OafA/YrhL